MWLRSEINIANPSKSQLCCGQKPTDPCRKKERE
jgi:hypothetical protein